jgi:Pentapeptide repeats (8 copies)
MDLTTAWKTVTQKLEQHIPSELGPPIAPLIGVFILVAYLLSLVWPWYKSNVSSVTPIATFIGAAVIAWAALQQAGTARLRHEEQTKADWRRRITESFSKAAEQLGHDKLEVRLGGIYTMERISKESPDDYWPVMETLTAFVRERARWKEQNDSATSPEVRPDETPDQVPDFHKIPTDIAAVLSVICRREEVNREREKKMRWLFDLRSTDLRCADLSKAPLEGACLMEAHLERGMFFYTHLEKANLGGAHLEGAILYNANCEAANFPGAHLEEAVLLGTHFDKAYFVRAHLEGAFLEGARLIEANLLHADLKGAHLEGADLSTATGLEEDQLAEAHGDASTILPEGVKRPAGWPASDS